jgi:hypothetical protein
MRFTMHYPVLHQMDMGEPLDTNAELVTVGWSNVLSGNLT